jgi:hypothetical protein
MDSERLQMGGVPVRTPKPGTRVQSLKTIPTAIAGAFGLILLATVSACGRTGQAAQAPSSDTVAATAAASSAEASASDAQGSAALARATVPAAGTVANASGDNQKTPPPSVSVAEEHEGTGDEAPQDLRNKVAAAKAAGRAPVQPRQ